MAVAYQGSRMETVFSENEGRTAKCRARRTDFIHTLHGKPLALVRGQSRRFLRRLISASMLVTKTDKNSTHITICNYDTYQDVRRTDDATPTQLRRSSDANYKEGNTLNPLIKEKKVVRATRFPDNFEPDIQFALKHGLTEKEAWTEVDKMRDWSISASGQKGVRADWDATWRNWIRRWSPPSKQNGGGRRTEITILAEMAQQAQERIDYAARNPEGGELEFSKATLALPKPSDG